MEQIGHQVDAENPLASSRGAPAQFPAALSFRVLPNLVCQFFNLFRFLQQIQRRQVRRVCLVHFRLQFPGELIESLDFSGEGGLGKFARGSLIGCGLRGNSCGWPMGSPADKPVTARRKAIEPRRLADLSGF
jgi:hypothetical protein